MAIKIKRNESPLFYLLYAHMRMLYMVVFATTKCLPVICFGSFGLTGYTPSHKKKCPLVPLPKSIALKSARFFHHLCLIADFGMYLLLVARTLCDISLIRFASTYFIGTNFRGENFSRGEKKRKILGVNFRECPITTHFV